MNEEEFFLISNLVDRYAEFTIGKCEICHVLPAFYVITYTNKAKTGVLLVCPKCYDKMDFQGLKGKENAEQMGLRETQGNEDGDGNKENQDTTGSEEINIVENTSEEAITLDKDETVEQARKKETWLTRFIQASIQNHPDPFSIIEDADVLGEEDIMDTIRTLGSVISYPFPTARKQAMRALGKILALPSLNDETRELALKNLMYFERDKDKSIQNEAKELHKKYK